MKDKEGSAFSGIECVLFEKLGKDSLKKIRKILEYRYFKKGEFLFKEGSIPQNVICIHEGHVKVYKMGSDGKEQVVYLCKSGDLIGWQQLFNDAPYSASSVALDQVMVSLIPRDKFIEVVRESPVSLSFIKYVCNTVVLLEEKVLELSQKSVRERLAANILFLMDNFGTTHSGKNMINLPLTREEYANIIGTNTETVIKLLSEFRKEKLIEFQDRRIVVLNVEALKKMSDFYNK